MENEHYAFITDCLADPGNAAKQQALEQWLAASQANQALFEEVKMLWEAAAELPAMPLNRQAGWEALSQQIGQTPATSPERAMRLSGSWWKAAAVVLPLLIAAGYWFYHTRQNSRVTYTALNTKDSLVLPDGTAVYLQQGARLSWTRSFKERHLLLEAGEAFFNVATDEQHSFSIVTANTTVKVLGTAFNVRTSADTTDVVVWEGKVSLDGKRHPRILLGPGDMGVVGRRGEAYKPPGDHRYRCGWANNDLVFYNQPVELVLRVLAAHYQLGELTLNPKLRDRRITVRFRQLKPNEAMNVLNALLDDELIKPEDTPSR
jgi:transmembrane sensor